MLSKRLETIASLVDTESIIDVGCDHGYLDIYLTKKGIKCLATDVNKSCLDKAIENFEKENLNIDTKLTDGLKGIAIKDTDTIVISGMGTDTIKKILSIDIKNDLIISSNNKLEDLRRYIVSIGYYISDEVFVLENNKPYVIIKFKYGKIEYNDYEYVIGPVINDSKYFNYLINKYNELLNRIPLKYIEKRNYYLKLIEYLNNKLDK